MTPISTLAGTTRRPRIGVDFHFFGPSATGAHGRLVALYRDAVRRAPEFDFTFFCPDPARLQASDPAFAMPNARCVALRPGGAALRLGVWLPLLVRAHRVDLLHLHEPLPLVPMLPPGPFALALDDVLALTHPPVPLRAAGWRARVEHAWRGATLRHAARRAALLLVPGAATLKDVLAALPVDPAKAVLTGAGVNLARFHPVSADGSDEWNGAGRVGALGAEPGEYLLAVGRDEPPKNRVGLVRAYASMAEPRPPLWIVGAPAADGAAVAEARSLGVQDGIRFVDHLADDDLAALMRHARVFVHPSLAEGFGTPVLEAMASGVATVVSTAPSLVELGAGAVLAVDPAEPKAIAGAIEQLLFDGALRRRLSAAGPAVADHHRWEVPVRAMLAAFKRHFSAHPPR